MFGPHAFCLFFIQWLSARLMYYSVYNFLGHGRFRELAPRREGERPWPVKAAVQQDSYRL